jgi:hypothetical protein
MGLQSLVACQGADTDKVKLFSNPALQMKIESSDPSDCFCGVTRFECARDDSRRDAFLDRLAAAGDYPPPIAPRYALASGDGQGASLGTAWAPSGDLYRAWGEAEDPIGYAVHTDYHADENDCLQGSRFLHERDVERSDGGCGLEAPVFGCIVEFDGHLDMHYQPAFIPVHSALDTEGVTLGECASDEPTERAYVEVGFPDRWTGWEFNGGNWPHCALSRWLSCRGRNFVVQSMEVGGADAVCGPFWAETAAPPDIRCSKL